ncbi:MAG TPA: biopolymer transporter ExbD [Myxococcaceae bacterium]|nr:biopolymer transporter ExbD [Myxococcaceae bacterium]
MSLGAKYHLHKKRKYAISEGRPNSDINVTPLVDVVLVLLIIFMVVTPLLEKDIQVRVPDDTETEVLPEDMQDQLVVSIDPTGQIKLNSEPLDDEAYKTRIKRALAAKSYEEKLVFFLPDDKAPYPRVVQVLDWSRAAGAYILGVVTEPVAGILPGGAPAPGAAPGEPGAAPAAPGAPPAPAGPTGGSK